jgi:sulfite exporter TauE/SafE
MMAHLDLFSLFMLGILGTGHCIGMCGPLVFAFPGQTGLWSSHINYHLGRIAAYALAGTVVGAIGAGLVQMADSAATAPWASITRIQVMFALVAAALLLVLGLIRLGWMPEPGFLTPSLPDKIPGRRKLLQSALDRRSASAMLGLGFFLGFLPCGLTYAALARALAAGGPVQGALYLLAFGIGTLPGLLIVGRGAFGLFQRYRRQSDILAGVLMLAMAFKLGFKALSSLH